MRLEGYNGCARAAERRFTQARRRSPTKIPGPKKKKRDSDFLARHQPRFGRHALMTAHARPSASCAARSQLGDILLPLKSPPLIDYSRTVCFVYDISESPARQNPRSLTRNTCHVTARSRQTKQRDSQRARALRTRISCSNASQRIPRRWRTITKLKTGRETSHLPADASRESVRECCQSHANRSRSLFRRGSFIKCRTKRSRLRKAREESRLKVSRRAKENPVLVKGDVGQYR